MWTKIDEGYEQLTYDKLTFDQMTLCKISFEGNHFKVNVCPKPNGKLMA
jgi:hypothetical protein